MLLVGTAAYLYLPDLLVRGQRWWTGRGQPAGERPLAPDRAERILEAAHDHFYRSLARSLNLPDLPGALTERDYNLRYGGVLTLRPGEDDPLSIPAGGLTVHLNGAHRFGGIRTGYLRGRVRHGDGGDTLVVLYRGDTVQLVFPARRDYYTPGETSVPRETGVPGSPLESLRRDTAVLTRWRGRRAVRMSWRAGASRIVQLYVSSRPPHAVLGSRYRSRNRRVRHLVTYRDETRRRRFSRFETHLDGRRAAELNFTYRGDRLRWLDLTTPGLEGIRGLRMTMVQGADHSRGGTVTIRSRWFGGRRTLGAVRWRWRDGLPSRFTVNVNAVRAGGTRGGGLRLALRNMRWHAPPPRVSLVSDTSHRRLTGMQVLGRILTLLEAGGDAPGRAGASPGGTGPEDTGGVLRSDTGDPNHGPHRPGGSRGEAPREGGLAL